MATDWPKTKRRKKMTRFCLCVAMLAAVLLNAGCGTTGILYTHVTVPFDTNMTQTPTGVNEEEGDIKVLTLDPLHPVSVLWDSNAIGDIAKANGMETVYFADIEILSVLGIWKQYTVHIYGK
jgi:hypothetical protein